MTIQTPPERRKLDMKVIALAVICVILAASLVGVIAVYQPSGNADLQAQLAAKDSTISGLQAQIADLQSRQSNVANLSTYITQIAQLNQALYAMNETLTSVQTEASTLQQYVSLEVSATLFDDTFVQNANATTSVYSGSIDYAGFIAVQVTSTSNTTYARVVNTFREYTLTYNQTLGQTGTTVFALLPGTVEVAIGNLNPADTNAVTVTVIYCY